MALLFKQLLCYLEETIANKSNNKDSFDEDLLFIFKRKIFSVEKLNFLQYLPLYLMNLKNKNDKWGIIE